MRTRTLLTLALSVVLLVSALAGPAAAGKKYELQQIGTGTWTAIDGGRAFTGTSAGHPVEGTTTGEITVEDGTLPPWPGCEPATGTISTTDGGVTVVLSVWGKLCHGVPLTADLVFLGWYDVVSYDGAKGRRVADGRGSLDIRSFSDGTLQWMITGDLY